MSAERGKSTARQVTAETPGAVGVTVWDLEMTERPSITVAERDDLVMLEATESAPELGRFFYREVGRHWHWLGRSQWTDEQWTAELERDAIHFWSCWRGGAPAGFFMLEEHSNAAPGNTELLYFGLLPRVHGQGLGRWLLERAIATAWALPSTTRLWLETCTLDGPHAVPNYEARGFRKCAERHEYRVIE